MGKLVGSLEELSRVVKELEKLVSSLRRVSYGDYVLAKDVNMLIDALRLLDRYNNLVVKWFEDKGYPLPQEAYDLVNDIASKVQQLSYVYAGDIIEPEPWNSITEVLGLEYELLKIFMEYLPRIPRVTDFAEGIEVSTLVIPMIYKVEDFAEGIELSRLTTAIGYVLDYVSWWIYERYQAPFAYVDEGDFLGGSIHYTADLDYRAGNPIVFEEFREIAVSSGLEVYDEWAEEYYVESRLRTLGIKCLDGHGYVFMGWLRVYDGPTGDLKYGVTLASFEYLAFAIDGTIQWAIESPLNGHHAVGTYRGSNLIYYVDNYEQALRALDAKTGEEVWRVSIYYSEDYRPDLVVDDVDGDGDPEIVVCTSRGDSDHPSKLMIVSAIDGTVKANWQYDILQDYYTGFTIHDIDRDGKSEYITANHDGNMAVIDDDGTILVEEYYYLPRYPTSEFGMSIWDIDGDGVLELLLGYKDEQGLECLTVPDLESKWIYWPEPFYQDYFFPPYLLDLDGDGRLESFLWVDSRYHTDVDGAHLVDDNGDLIWHLYLPYRAWCNYTVGDVDGDGKAEGVIVVNYKLYVLKG